MGNINKSNNPRVAYLYDTIFNLLQNDDIEIAISALLNILQTGLYAFGIEQGMDREEFILYVNDILNEVKKDLFNNDRLDKLEDFGEDFQNEIY